MKISYLVYVGIAGLVVISIAVAVAQSIQVYDDTLRVAFFPNIGHAVPIVGLEEGIFSNELSDQVTIQTKLFDSGPQVIESLFANSIDVAYVGPGPVINGYLKSDGKDLKILAGAASGGVSFVVHPTSSIASAQDFDGKRIAAPQISNTQDVSLRNYLAENGLRTAEKGGSVVVLNVANPDIYTLFAKGDIDGAWVSEPWATMLVQELGGTRLFHEEELWPNGEFSSVLLIARTDYLETHPQIIQKWLDAHIKTVTWINQNPEKTKIIFNDYLKETYGKGLPDKVVDESFSNLKITSEPLEDSVLTFAKRADSLGYLGRDGYNLDGIFYDTDISQPDSLEDVV